MACFSAPPCAIWSAMQSSTPNREVAFLLAAGTPVRESGSMCATRALEFLVSKFRESSRRSPGLIPQNATAWASDLHRAPSARNFGPPHRRRLHSLPRVPLFHFRGTRDEEEAKEGERRTRRERNQGRISRALPRQSLPRDWQLICVTRSLFPIGINDIARARLPQRPGMGDGAATSFRKGEYK